MYHVTKTTQTIQASPTHSYIVWDPSSRGSPQIHLGKHRNKIELKTLTNNAFWLIRQGRTAHPHHCSPIWRRARGQGAWGAGSPQSQLAERGVPLNHTPLPWIEYAAVHPMFDAMLTFWQQPLWKSIFQKKYTQNHLSDWPSLDWGL